MMKDVGIRELKARLSAYLDEASNGTQIRITERGRPRWMLVKLPDEDPIARGIREGWISAGPAFRGGQPRPAPRAVPSRPGVRLDDVFDDDRGR